MHRSVRDVVPDFSADKTKAQRQGKRPNRFVDAKESEPAEQKQENGVNKLNPTSLQLASELPRVNGDVVYFVCVKVRIALEFNHPCQRENVSRDCHPRKCSDMPPSRVETTSHARPPHPLRI